MGVSRHAHYHHTLLWLLVLSCGRTVSSGSHVKRQYFAPAPEILPAPVVEPAPVVLPAGVVESAGAIAPAGLISPAPLIAPAPAILPADAIKEKDRAYPGPKGKRYDIPIGGYGTQTTDSAFDTNQYPRQYSNQDNLVSYGDFQQEQEQYDPWRSGSASDQGGSLNYFDPGFGTQTAGGSPDKSSSSFGPRYSDLIKDENDLTASLIREIDQEGSAIASASFDNLQSGDQRQAVSEGLVTAQGLSANELKNTPLTRPTEAHTKKPTTTSNAPPQDFRDEQVDNNSSSWSTQSALSGNSSSSASHVRNVTNKILNSPSTLGLPTSSSSFSSDLQNTSSSSPSSLSLLTSSSSSSSSSSPSSSLSSSSSSSSSQSSSSSLSSSTSSSSSPILSNASTSSPLTTTPSSNSTSTGSSSLPADSSLLSFEPEAQKHSQMSPSSNDSSASVPHSPEIPSINAGQTLSTTHSEADNNANSVISDSQTGDKKNLQQSVTATLSTHDAAVDREAASLGKSEHQTSTREDFKQVKQVSQQVLGITNIPSKLASASTSNQQDSLSSIITASEQRLKSSDANKTMLPAVASAKTPPRSPDSSLPALIESDKKPAKAESEFRHLKHAGANLVPSKLYAPGGLGELQDSTSAKPTAAPPPRPTMPPGTTAKTLPVVSPTQTHFIRDQPQNETGKAEYAIPKVQPTQAGFIPQSDHSAGSHASYSLVDHPSEKRLDEAKLLGMLVKEKIAKYVHETPKSNAHAVAEQAARTEARNETQPTMTGGFKSDVSEAKDSKNFRKVDHAMKKTVTSFVDLKSLLASTRHSLPALSKKSLIDVAHRNTRSNLVSKPSLVGHMRTRRQVLVPVLPLDNSPPQLQAPILTPPQQMLGPTEPVIPVMQQFQQPVQPDIPTQQFFASPADQALPMSPLLAQPALAPVTNPMTSVAGLQSLMQFAPQRNEIGMPQALPQDLSQPLPQSLPQDLSQPLPQSLPQALPQPQQFLAPVGSPSRAFDDAPLPSPGRYPSMLAATQAYKDLQDINSRSHMLDEVMKDIGGDERYNEGNKYDYANQEAWLNSDTKDYDGKRKYSELSTRDFDFSNGDNDNFGTEPFSKRMRNHEYDRGSYTESEDDDYGWRPRKAWHRPARKFTMNDGNEDYDEGARSSEIVGRRFHPADDTTENAIKESHSRETGRHSDEADTSYDSYHTSRSYSEAVTSPSSNDAHETEAEEDSEDSKQNETADKKIDPHSDLKDNTDEDDSVVAGKKVATSPAHASTESKEMKKSRSSHVLERLNTDSVMHLNFNKPLQSHKNMADDQSGNGNDADLANGATISTRNFGTCGHGVDLNKGEIVYHSKSFIRKPTKAVSIAMWVKSRKPGLVRWFDFGDSPKAGKSDGGKPVTVPKNRWTHLAGTFETKTGVSRVYVNGDLLSERVGKVEKELPQDFTATGLGHKFGDEFVAFLDDLYMFDRVISPEEVKVLYKKCEFNRMILHFGFQKVNMSLQTLQLQDQSGLMNNASIAGGAHVMTSGCDKCGACLDASSGEKPGVYMDGKAFHRKPTSGVTIAAWVSLNKTKGLHSIFQALDNKDEKISVYNMEVVNGRLHWRHKSRSDSKPVFDMTTADVVVPENLWIHVGATYNSTSGTAKLYVNGIQKAEYTNSKKPKLWSSLGKMAIGGHIQDNSPFDGLLDEFFIYNWELDPSELHFVMKYCADHPKLVSFTVRVPIYKRQKIQRNH